MRVSFDLDNTLICYGSDVPREPNQVPLLLRRWFREPLRAGACQLMVELQQRGCEIWVYTTSFRRRSTVAWWLWFYGIRISGFVNQRDHLKHARDAGIYDPPSKYPPGFGIGLHVDDLEGVRAEGEKLGFQVLVVSPVDVDWHRKVIVEVDRILGAVHSMEE